MDGIILIDKPKDFTSFDVVAVLRGVLHQKKLGHTGTLDPMATGVLAVMSGRATRLIPLLPDRDKRYLAGIRFGVTTDTLDITGKELSSRDCDISQSELSAALSEFTGEIMQTPPMYSAVQVNGVRLYKLARQGIEIERESRGVTVYSASVTSKTAKNEFTLDVSCSSGTYIRTLCDDIGKKLGTGAVMTSLRRVNACGFNISDCVTLEEAKLLPPEKLITPAEEILRCYDEITVSPAQAKRFLNGGQLSLDRLKLKNTMQGLLRIYSPDRTLLGLGEICTETGLLNIKWLAVTKD